MKTVNLRDFYPWYTQDELIEVSDEVAESMAGAERAEHAYYERRRYNKAFYSINLGDGIEHEAIYASPSPEDILGDGLMREQLYAALNALPEKQRKRIFKHYILGISKAEIAKAEGISEKNVRQAIERGLLSLWARLKNYF